MRDIEGGGCTIWFKPFPGVCVCDDDRRERAQGVVSCTELLLVVVVVKLSQNILLLAPPQVSDRGSVLRRVWRTEEDGKGGGVWLLSAAAVEGWLLCKNATCFPSLWEDPRKRSCWWWWWWCCCCWLWLCNLASAEEVTSEALQAGLTMAVDGYTCGLEKGSNWVPETLNFLGVMLYPQTSVKLTKM